MRGLIEDATDGPTEAEDQLLVPQREAPSASHPRVKREGMRFRIMH